MNNIISRLRESGTLVFWLIVILLIFVVGVVSVAVPLHVYYARVKNQVEPEIVIHPENRFERTLRVVGDVDYKPFSYFEGATPKNNYTPNKPYKITVKSNQYSFTKEGSGHEWVTLWVTSGGADNPRSIKLRKKGSTGQWFLNDIQCLSDIRTPANEDPWD